MQACEVGGSLLNQGRGAYAPRTFAYPVVTALIAGMLHFFFVFIIFTYSRKCLVFVQDCIRAV